MAEDERGVLAHQSAPITRALENSSTAADAPWWLRWRTGRKVGRTVYAQVGHEPSDNDVLIGVMDTRQLADEVVMSHNRVLFEVQDDG